MLLGIILRGIFHLGFFIISNGKYAKPFFFLELAEINVTNIIHRQESSVAIRLLDALQILVF